MQCDSIFYCLDLGLLLRSRRNKAQMKAASETKPPSSISHSSLSSPHANPIHSSCCQRQLPSALPNDQAACLSPSLPLCLSLSQKPFYSHPKAISTQFDSNP